MEQQLVVRPRVAVRMPGVHWHEHERVAVDGDLERLQFAMSQIVRRCRNEPVNKRVRIPSIIHNRGAADVLDDPDVAPVIRMDAFVTATAEAAIERAQTGAALRCSDQNRRPSR